MMTDRIIKSHCNNCGQGTKHIVRFEHKIENSEEIESGRFSVEWCDTYTVLECCGCEDVSLKRQQWCSEWMDEGTVDTYYPPRVSRRRPSFFDKIPEKYSELLDEIYSALHANNKRLAMMGARTIFDAFILEKVGDVRGFKAGLMALNKNGFIAEKSLPLIEAAIDAGHAASHRSYRPSVKNMMLVMDVIENILQTDLLAKAEEELRKSTPKRESAKKSGK